MPSLLVEPDKCRIIKLNIRLSNCTNHLLNLGIVLSEPRSAEPSYRPGKHPDILRGEA